MITMYMFREREGEREGKRVSPLEFFSGKGSSRTPEALELGRRVLHKGLSHLRNPNSYFSPVKAAEMATGKERRKIMKQMRFRRT